jgi:hypothetical protein
VQQPIKDGHSVVDVDLDVHGGEHHLVQVSEALQECVYHYRVLRKG